MSDNDQITGRQLAAARVLAGFSQGLVAKLANVSIPTLRRMEASLTYPSSLPNNVEAVRRALEAEGIEFTWEADGRPGVKVGPKGISRPPA